MDKNKIRDLAPIPRRLALLSCELRGIERRMDRLVDEISLAPDLPDADEISSTWCRYLRGVVCLVTWHRCQLDPKTDGSEHCLFRTWQDSGGLVSLAERPGSRQDPGTGQGGIPPARGIQATGLLEHLVNQDWTGRESDPRSPDQGAGSEGAVT